MSPARWATVAAALFLACSKSPQEKTQKASETLASLSATGAMVAKQWEQQKLPDRYVTKTLELAAGDVEKQRKAAQSDPKLTQAIDDVGKELDALRGAVVKHDASAASQHGQRLDALAKSLQPEKSE